MICPHCGNYYEYKGEVCLKEGQLTIKHATEETARACLERMIYHFTGIKKEEPQQKEKEAPREPEYRQLYLFGV